MKTLKDYQNKTDETLKEWGYESQRDLIALISGGEFGGWTQVYKDILDNITDRDILDFVESCKSIDLNKLSKDDIKNLVTLVWISILCNGDIEW
jgi:hypothetical protein